MGEHAPGELLPREGLARPDWEPGPDAELATAVRTLPWEQGGSDAFWALWLRYEPRIWRSVRRVSLHMCPRNVERQVFAEALLERVQAGLVRGVGRYRGPAPFGAFLKTVVVRAAIDQCRYYGARPQTRAGGEAVDPDQLDSAASASYRVRSLPSPERVVATKERKAILHEALRLLAMRSPAAVHWAAALRRFYLEGQEGGEIAREMGCTKDAVHKYLERGRDGLKGILQSRFGVDEIEELL